MVKKYRSIPIPKNAKIAKERGILRYRVVFREGERYRLAVTKKPGPRGGRTIVVAKLEEIKKVKKK
jgi:hypothetical protein